MKNIDRLNGENILIATEDILKHSNIISTCLQHSIDIVNVDYFYSCKINNEIQDYKLYLLVNSNINQKKQIFMNVSCEYILSIKNLYVSII